MLAESQTNKGAKGSIVTGAKRVPVKDDTPTLSDMGIDKKLQDFDKNDFHNYVVSDLYKQAIVKHGRFITKTPP